MNQDNTQDQQSPAAAPDTKTTDPERINNAPPDDPLMDEELMDDEDISDPQFQAFMTYIEGAAHKLISELRDAEPEPSSDQVHNAEPELEPEPEPGTAEYDLQHEIPHYELA